MGKSKIVLELSNASEYSLYSLSMSIRGRLMMKHISIWIRSDCDNALARSTPVNAMLNSGGHRSALHCF